MMEYKSQLKLQAYLDHELPEAEAQQVAEWVARDREAAELLRELRETRAALEGFEAAVRLPESREFFWSKVQRAIQRQSAGAPERSGWSLRRLQRFLVPASALGLLAVVLTLSVGRSSATPPGEMELVSEDMCALTFRSQSERMTMVWLYPRGGDAQAASAVAPVDFDEE